MCDKTALLDVSTIRLRELIDNVQKTREEIGNGVGLDTSTITKYYNGDRKLTIEAVKKFSKFFNVSADYLLGLSDARTNDKDIQAVCDYTGIDYYNVVLLHSLAEDMKQVENIACLEEKMITDFSIDNDEKSIEFESYVASICLDVINDLIGSQPYFEIFRQARRFKDILEKLTLIENTLTSVNEKITSAETENETLHFEKMLTSIDNLLSPMLQVIGDCSERNDLVQFYGGKIEQIYAQSIRKRIENSEQNTKTLLELLKKTACIKGKMNSFPNSVTETEQFGLLEFTIDMLENGINEIGAAIKWQP